MNLHNIRSIHTNEASEIDALTLLHFVADAVKDWECVEFECNICPWFCIRNGHEGTNKICLLEGLKDKAFEMLEKNAEDQNE